MAKTETAEQLATALHTGLGSRLVAFLVYGSAARGDGAHVAGRSDVNTLLIVDAVDEGLFAVIGPLVARWRAAGHPAPILLSLAEWRDSTDVFAIEYEDIREAHRLLAGRDPWPGVSVQRADVRRQLEQELMGKLVRLRQAYAALGGDRKRLAEALAGSVGGYLTMLRALLRLGGRAAPGEPAAVVRAAADLVGFPADAVADLIAQRRHPERLKLGERDPRASAYLAAVARTAEYVNRLT